MKQVVVVLFVVCAGWMAFAAEKTIEKQSGPIQTAFLYAPTNTVIADVIPFFWNDEFHLLHLRLNPGQKGWDWAQIITRDFTAFKDAGVAIPGGRTDDAEDFDIFTGSVLEKDGTLYAFYTGHNVKLKNQQRSDQLILRATSSDGVVWTKDPSFRFSPEGDSRYRQAGACRDSFVFRNPEKDEFGMIFTATPANAPGGGAGYAGSKDLKSWRLDAALAASGRFPGYECPDLFRWGDRWYLLFSTYRENPGWATRYMTAPSLEGPWESPVDDFFDGGSLYAAKSVSNGARRFLCGTLTRRTEKRDDDLNGWGGPILVYEMLRRDDGTLGVRIPPEVEESFGSAKNVMMTLSRQWVQTNSGVRCVEGPANQKMGKLPERCLFSMNITMPPTGRAGLWIGGDAQGKQAFRLYVDVATQRLVWDRGNLPLGSDPGKERPYRPLKVRPGDRITLKVALDGDSAVACVNDATCLSTRIYDRRENTFGIWSDTIGAEFGNATLRASQETKEKNIK